MTAATLLILLGTPGLWTCINPDPFTICEPAGACVIAARHEMLLSERSDDLVTITPVPRELEPIVRNLVMLRAADAAALARDRAERARQERMEVRN